MSRPMTKPLVTLHSGAMDGQSVGLFIPARRGVFGWFAFRFRLSAIKRFVHKTTHSVERTAHGAMSTLMMRSNGLFPSHVAESLPPLMLQNDQCLRHQRSRRNERRTDGERFYERSLARRSTCSRYACTLSRCSMRWALRSNGTAFLYLPSFTSNWACRTLAFASYCSMLAARS